VRVRKCGDSDRLGVSHNANRKVNQVRITAILNGDGSILFKKPVNFTIRYTSNYFVKITLPVDWLVPEVNR